MKSTRQMTKALLWVGLVSFLVFTFSEHVAAQTVTLISNHPSLTNPGAITTDGVNLYVGNDATILSVPIGGGAATTLYAGATPCCVVGLTRMGTDLFWIDPNGDPDATAIFRGSTSGGPITKIYSGFATGQPIVDGAGITTDGTKLYTTDHVQGRVHSLNPDGSAITFLGSRYGGFFFGEHFNTLAESGGILYITDDGTQPSFSPPLVVSIPKTGGSFTTLHSGAPFVRPVAIAVGNGTVFVADQGANTIWSLPITGGAPTALVSGAPFVQLSGNGLIFFNNALYVTDNGNIGATDGPGAIYRVDLAITVSVDIKPGSDPNSINLKSKGVVPVAILGSANFDVDDVDVNTVQFAGATPVRFSFEDVNLDGHVDLVFHFRTQDLQLTTSSTQATLTGETTGGTPITGTDSVRIVP